jgi:peptidoglycan/xylan/chitin deacetylase (PgdA/CDA1 family)
MRPPSQLRRVGGTSAITLLFHDVYRESPDESGFPSEAAHRYKLSSTAFDAQLAGIEAARRDLPLVSNELPLGIPRVGRRSSTPAAVPSYLITFDDGGESFYTLAADRLEHQGWRGHCFVTTDMIGRHGFLTPSQIQELDRRGHIIGSHSASHPRRCSALSLDDMRGEWKRSRNVLEDILGRPVDVASVPGGFFSRTVAAAAHEAGIRVLFTSEPVTSISMLDDCLILGRFTIRRGDPGDTAQRLVASRGWARSRAWFEWNAKGLVKPLLGDWYVRFTHWLAVRRAVNGPPATATGS